MNGSLRKLIFSVALSWTLGCGRVVIFEIPDSYVGWVYFDFLDETCAYGSEKAQAVTVIRIQSDGSACSRSLDIGSKLHASLFYYVDDQGARIRELRSTGWGEGGEIWGLAARSGRNQHSVFIGSEEEFQKPHHPSRRPIFERLD